MDQTRQSTTTPTANAAAHDYRSAYHDAKADALLDAVRAGGTVRIEVPAIAWSHNSYRRYCRQHPQWATEVRRISQENAHRNLRVAAWSETNRADAVARGRARRARKAAQLQEIVHKGGVIADFVGKKRHGAAWAYNTYAAHCRENPEWASELKRISLQNHQAAKLASRPSEPPDRTCRNGHGVSGANAIRYSGRDGATLTRCKACQTISYGKMSAELRKAVIERLEQQHSIYSFTRPGAGYLLQFKKLEAARANDAELDRLVVAAISHHRSRSGSRWETALAAFVSRKRATRIQRAEQMTELIAQGSTITELTSGPKQIWSVPSYLRHARANPEWAAQIRAASAANARVALQAGAELEFRRNKAAMMTELVANGATIRRLTLTTPVFWDHKSFQKHLRENPTWGAEIKAASAVNAKRNNAEAALKRSESIIYCASGHDLRIHGRLTFRPNGHRSVRCRECNRQKGKFGGIVTPEIVDRFKAGFLAGMTIKDLTENANSKTYVTYRGALAKARSIDPELDRIYAERRSLEGRQTIGTIGRADNSEYFSTYDDNEYTRIRLLVPHWLPAQMRDDITQEIFVALLEGRIERREVRSFLDKFLIAQRRAFPDKFAKFGRARLVSLDAARFEGGRETVGDYLSQGLWT